MKPRIAITSGLTGTHWAPDGVTWRAYAQAVIAAGGEPVHLDPSTRGREAETLAGVQGLLLPGGNDIDVSLFPHPPDLQGEDPAAYMARHRMTPEPERDSYELPLLFEALERDLPVLGICRGCQLIQVGTGGGLLLDIPLQVPGAIEHRSCPRGEASSHHALEIVPGSRLAEAFPSGAPSRCNSRHHQACRVEEGGATRAVAHSPEDGIVEAVEVPGRWWVLGVQWHPEFRADEEVRREHAPLFAAFLRAATG
ncbi:MAG: gamma-glutamyl-gamma-aminobutyrate hydrolase family protein [Armatimonadota bacterium]